MALLTHPFQRKASTLAITALLSSSFSATTTVSSFVITKSKNSISLGKNNNINFVNRFRGGSGSVSSDSSNNQKNIRHIMTSSNTAKISISDAFDGGNGKLIKTETTSNNEDGKKIKAYVEIQKDPYTELEQTNHHQYFSFRSTSNEPCKVIYVLSNAGNASYPIAWDGSTTFVSSTPNDECSWKRVLDTTYNKDTGELSWTYEHDKNAKIAYFSYFPPYSYERHLNLISQCDMCPNANVMTLGQTLDGREMDCVKVGDGSNTCWIIHRQHPGESMAEFYAEGLLERLLGLKTNYAVDGMVRDALKQYTFYIVPNMCPDGSVRGHLRTNAHGQNLNREWCSSTYNNKDENDIKYEAPSIERSPEVYHVLKKMDETDCDVFLDIHGDEELPYNFLAGGEGCPNWSTRLQSLHGAFLAKYSRTNSDMQIPIGYEPEETGKGRLNVCSNQIGVRYDCLAATLEMPFKDCASNPDPDNGWNPVRSKMLGASVLEPLLYVAPYLRGDPIEWVKEDAYVSPTSDYKSL